MIDLKLLQSLSLEREPVIAHNIVILALSTMYKLKNVDIKIENLEKIPKHESVIFAMNHSDRYNYLPFQWYLFRAKYNSIPTWVKGKYYENPFTSYFFNSTHNIPVPSRGYLYTKDFELTMKRPPTNEEYLIISKWKSEPFNAILTDDIPENMKILWSKERTSFGFHFDPSKTTYPAFIENTFYGLMDEFSKANLFALKTGKLNILIFPEGTRSVRLSKGHMGIMQIAYASKAPIIPIGCNGSHLVYPKNSPIPKTGKIVYRVGDILRWDKELLPFDVKENIKPFSPETEKKHGKIFQAGTDFVMDKINSLLDKDQQYQDSALPEEKGWKRFL